MLLEQPSWPLDHPLATLSFQPSLYACNTPRWVLAQSLEGHNYFSVLCFFIYPVHIYVLSEIFNHMMVGAAVAMASKDPFVQLDPQVRRTLFCSAILKLKDPIPT